MTILLTTPYDPGDLDPGETYTHVAIREIREHLHDRHLEFLAVHGTIVAGTFVTGKLEPRRHVITDRPRTGATDYSDLRAKVSKVDENVSTANERALDEYLLSSRIHEGTIRK